jgi:hypothetical protein
MIPFDADQFDNSDRIVTLGAGETLKLLNDTLPEADFIQSMNKMLNNRSEYINKIDGIKASFLQSLSPTLVVDRIEQLIRDEYKDICLGYDYIDYFIDVVNYIRNIGASLFSSAQTDYGDDL